MKIIDIPFSNKIECDCGCTFEFEYDEMNVEALDVSSLIKTEYITELSICCPLCKRKYIFTLEKEKK